MICIEVAHSLPYRLRLRFKPALQMHHAFGIQTELSSAYPDLPLRLWGLGQGIIIGNGTYPLDPNLVSDIAKLINNPVDGKISINLKFSSIKSPVFLKLIKFPFSS